MKQVDEARDHGHHGADHAYHAERLQLADVVARGPVARQVRLAIEANLDGTDTRWIERPARDTHAGANDGFDRRRIDGTDSPRR